MSINVTKFLVSNDLASIDLDVNVTVGQTVTQLLLWTEATYKDPSKSIDLSSLIVGSSEVESLTISASNAGVSSFTGIYFLSI